MMETCETLSRTIQPEDKDERILRHLWLNVYNLLEQDENLKPATKAEYLENVKSYPEGDFIGKVRGMVNAGQESVTSWGSLFSDGTYLIFFCLQC